MTLRRCDVGLRVALALALIGCYPLAACFGAAPEQRGHRANGVEPADLSRAAQTDLCTGLVTDLTPRPVAPLAKPSVGQPIADPAFGTRVRRISDAAPKEVVKPLYSTVQAWNADESRLILYHTGVGSAGHSLYDGRNYRYIKELDIRPADIEQVYWDARDPDILYYIDNYADGHRPAFIRYHVAAGRQEVTHYFACAGSVGADSHGYASWDTRVIGLACHTPARERFTFVYDISTSQEGPHRSLNVDGAPLTAPSGSLFYLHGRVLDRDLQELRALDVGNPSEHASLGRLPNGHDTYNEASYDGRYTGSLVSHDMTDGSVRVIIGPSKGFPFPPSSTHVSAVAFRRPGWIVISSVGSPPRVSRPLEQEIYLANTDPADSRFCRIAHHRSWGGEGHFGYWGEPHVSISPSGTRVVFGSDWGGGPSVDSYVVELPAYANAQPRASD